MTWADLLFLHWPVEPAAIRKLVPAPLDIDLFDNQAWVALVPFRMRNARFRGWPSLPGLSDFYECNVRTYVRYRGLSGVWFFSLDAERLLPVLGGRWLWSLNYVAAGFDVRHDPAAARFDYSLSRRPGPWQAGHTRIVWTCHEPLPAAATGSIERFLTERYWLFTQRRGRILAGQVHHPTWPLRRATVESLDDSLVTAAGLGVCGQPLAWASDGVDVEGWSLREVDEPVSRAAAAMNSVPHPAPRAAPRSIAPEPSGVEAAG